MLMQIQIQIINNVFYSMHYILLYIENKSETPLRHTVTTTYIFLYKCFVVLSGE